MNDSGSGPFPLPQNHSSIPADPEALFMGLRGRSPSIQYLWSHQSEVLKEWFSNHQETQDVAFELPPGTGKKEMSAWIQTQLSQANLDPDNVIRFLKQRPLLELESK